MASLAQAIASERPSKSHGVAGTQGSFGRALICPWQARLCLPRLQESATQTDVLSVQVMGETLHDQASNPRPDSSPSAAQRTPRRGPWDHRKGHAREGLTDTVGGASERRILGHRVSRIALCLSLYIWQPVPLTPAAIWLLSGPPQALTPDPRARLRTRNGAGAREAHGARALSRRRRSRGLLRRRPSRLRLLGPNRGGCDAARCARPGAPHAADKLPLCAGLRKLGVLGDPARLTAELGAELS